MAVDEGRSISGEEWRRRQEGLRAARSGDLTLLRDGSPATRQTIEALVAADLAARAAEDG